MADGPLKSIKFKDNDRLQNCAQFDRDHVMPQSPESEHVRKIQEALRELEGAPIPAGERHYGDKTIEAVVKFKTKHGIFTRGTRSIDPITGINTIRKLDALLALRDPPPKPEPPPGPVVKDPVFILSGQCQLLASRPDNPLADDLKFADPIASRKSVTTAAVTAPFVALQDSDLKGIMVSVMATAVAVAGKSEESLRVKAEAVGMCQHFFTAGGPPKFFEKGSPVSNVARDDDGFINFTTQFTGAIDRVVRRQWKAGQVNDVLIASEVRAQAGSFGVGKFSGTLTACIGGFQGFNVKMCNFKPDTAKKEFSYSLDCEIFDHFGVDETDINRGDAGGTLTIGAAMASFFVLQHDRAAVPANFLFRRFRPYRVTIRLDSQTHTGRVF